ncbi:MAG: ferritin family protein [Thermodesulfobacteriota bacterium]
MNTAERIQALEIAIENEAREAEFYRKHSERTNNILGKKMFISLAHDEREHMERIRALQKKLQERGHWPQDVPLEIEGTQVKEVLRSFVGAVEKLSQADRDDMDAVRIAIEFEQKGEAFYRDLAAKVEDSREKEFFALLASMEHDHLVSLKDTLEYFQNPEGWFAAKERHTIDGA